MTPDSDTPRTDAEALKYLGHSEVNADFARELERELTRDRAVIAKCFEHRKALESRLAEAERDARRWNKHKEVMDATDECAPIIQLLFEGDSARYEAAIDTALRGERE